CVDLLLFFDGDAGVRARAVTGVQTCALQIFATASIAQMILAEAVLVFLTLGVQPPRATWGRMLHEAEPLLSTRPAVVAAPGFAKIGRASGRVRQALGACSTALREEVVELVKR